MKNTIVFTSVLILASLTSAAAFAQGLTSSEFSCPVGSAPIKNPPETLADCKWDGIFSAKAAELSCHRIDRLVTLGKIDEEFLTKLERVEVTTPDAGAPAGAVFMTIASQTSPGSGDPFQLKLYQDGQGKTLKHEVLAGGAAGSDPQWPDKDPVSLSENALHYVLENGEINADIEPFLKAFTNLTLTKETQNGAPVAQGIITSSATAKKLKILLDMAGEFISSEIIQ